MADQEKNPFWDLKYPNTGSNQLASFHVSIIMISVVLFIPSINKDPSLFDQAQPASYEPLRRQHVKQAQFAIYLEDLEHKRFTLDWSITWCSFGLFPV